MCKKVFPIKDFHAHKEGKFGLASECKKCAHIRHSERWYGNKEKVTDKYLKLKVSQNYNIPCKLVTQELIDTYRLEYEARRSFFYHLDGKEFKTLALFCWYLKNTYGIPYYTTYCRLKAGATEEECLIPRNVWNAMQQSVTKQIKITDTVTREVFLFYSIKAAGAKVGKSTITRSLKTGNNITRGGRNALSKNSLKIELI